MNSRTSIRNQHSRPRHHEAQQALSRALTELRITVSANEPIGTVVRDNAIAAIASARPELQECYADWSDRIDEIRHIEAFHGIANHYDLVEELTALSVELKLRAVNHPEAGEIAVDWLTNIERMVDRLDDCRERTTFFR